MSGSELQLPPDDPGLSLAEFCLGSDNVDDPALAQPMNLEPQDDFDLPPDVEGCLEEPPSSRCGFETYDEFVMLLVTLLMGLTLSSAFQQPRRWMDVDCACSRNCLQRFGLEPELAAKVTAFKDQLSSMATRDRDRFIYSMLWDMHKKEDGRLERVTAFQFLGIRVCQTAFLQFLGVSKTHYTRRVESILKGLIEGPVDGRSIRKIREKPAMMNADAFFNFLYLHVAEPLAEGWGHEEWDAKAAENLEGGIWDEVPKELLEKGDVHLNPFDEWVLGKGDNPNPDLASGVPVAARDQRWLNHQNLADLYSQYELWVSGAGGSPVSLSVFQKCWKRTWQGVLRIRRVSQHSRCEDCALYCEFRKQATEATRESITGLTMHISEACSWTGRLLRACPYIRS